MSDSFAVFEGGVERRYVAYKALDLCEKRFEVKCLMRRVRR